MGDRLYMMLHPLAFGTGKTSLLTMYLDTFPLTSRIDAAGKGAVALLNRDLKEEARSEDEANLCPSVAFGPDGGLIAASQV